HKTFTIGGNLYITSVSREDEFNSYKCQIRNSLTNDILFSSTSGKLIITGFSFSPNYCTVRLVKIENGRNAYLPCIAHGFPVPHYRWYRKSSEREQIEYVNIDSGRTYVIARTGILVIRNVSKSDSGQYICVVNNSEGEDKMSFDLVVKASLSVIVETSAQRIEAGQEVTLSCVVKGFPVHTTYWVKNMKTINTSTHRVKLTASKFLHIAKVERQDHGCYQCFAVGDENESAEGSVCLYLSENAPKLKETFKKHIINPSDRLSLKCVASGNPLPTVTWTIDGGRELPLSERNKVFENGTLLILDTHRELDEGTYVCEAINHKGEKARRDLHIQVLKKPVITPFYFPQSLTEGMRVMITCNVLTGDAPIVFHWYKDNKTLDSFELDVQKTEVTDMGSTLVFRSISKKHAGNYTCVASNKIGEDRLTATMIVKVPPKWRIEPNDKSVVVGDRVTFDCQADGYPSPLIRWKATTVVRLFVHAQAKFKSNFQVIKVRKGEPLKIMCEAFGEKPIDIKWIKDKIEIDSIVERKRLTIARKETIDGAISELISLVASRSDSGSYLCIASNPFGQSELTSRVLVEEVPDEPSDIKIVDRGSKSITFKVTPPYSGNSQINKYIVQWKRENDSWSADTFKNEFNANLHQFTIENLRPFVKYNFRVFAVNAIGQSKSSAIITVTTDEEVPETAPVSIRTEALSSKSIRIKWKPPRHIENIGSISGYYIGHKINHSNKQYTFTTVEAHSDKPLEFTFDNLKKATSYVFTIQAFNSKGAGPLSPEVVCRTLDKDPPLAPKLKVISSSATSAKLKWILNEDANHITGKCYFFVFYALNLLCSSFLTAAEMSFGYSKGRKRFRIFLRSNNDWKLHETISDGTLTSYTIHSLKCGTKYQIYLIAFNEVGSSERSEVLSFQTDGLAPVAPDKQSLMTVNSTYIMLHLSSWKTNACPINNFVIQYKQQGQNEWILLSNIVPPFVEDFLLNDLYPGVWYNLLISAHSDAGSTEAEYLFATLTEKGGTVAPIFINPSSEEHRSRRFIQMLLPITSVFIAVLLIVIFVLFFGYKRNNGLSSVQYLGDNLSQKCDNISMSSAKVVYETVQKDERTSVYCPSPYAATQMSVYFQDNNSRDIAVSAHDNCYDMPLL
ncbi:cell adhesion molecule-like protein, partial [Dinothrombium tinctorium]